MSAKELRVARADDGKRTLSGYAIVYNSQSVDLGGFTEVMAPGALKRTLTESPDVLMLRDHDSSLLLGRTKSGTLSLSDDQTGLHFSCALPDTTVAADLAASVDRGDLDACSFGFSCVNDTWTQDAQGNVIRTLLDVELYEISCVSFPAYPSTTAALRSAPSEIRSAIAMHKRAADCTCDCPECSDGDCSTCSDTGCTCEGCTCEQEASRSWRETTELRIRLHEMLQAS